MDEQDTKNPELTRFSGLLWMFLILNLETAAGVEPSFANPINQEGVISLINQLRALEKPGIRGEILVSKYLNFIEPLAPRSPSAIQKPGCPDQHRRLYAHQRVFFL